MKLRWCFYATLLVLAGCACFGVVKRGTYTDITLDNAYLDDIYVAQIPEELCVSDCERLEMELPSVSEIVRVTALRDVEHLAGTSRQLVRVQEVYQGTALEEGDEVYVTFYRWSLSLSDEPFSIERGFVNVMEAEEEYLLFLEGQADGLGEETPVYRLYGESIIAPVFSYREHDNLIADMAWGSTYVPYDQVRENEFFAVSQTALDAFAELKRKVLEKYPAAGSSEPKTTAMMSFTGTPLT